MTENPERVKVDIRRRSKHSDRIIDHSKACTSAVITETAYGVLLLSYICRKGKDLYNTWMLNSLPGTK